MKSIVFYGPSGAGKSTLINMLLKDNPHFQLVASHTTRPKRSKEIDGIHYHFVDKDQFQKLISEKKFLEWTLFSNNHYGTSTTSLEKIFQKNPQNVAVLDLDYQGVVSMKTYIKERAKSCENSKQQFIFVYIKPPSTDILRQRLKNSNRNNIELRLKQAEKDLNNVDNDLFDIVIVNDVLKDTYQKLSSKITTNLS